MSLPQTTEEKKTTIDTGDTGSNAVAPLAKEIIDKKLEEANHITELDSSLGAIKKEIEHKSSSKHIETIPENMTIAQAVEQFFAEQQNNTLDQLDKSDKNEVGLLATDLAVYQCIVSVIDHIMTQILAKNPSITQADMKQAISTIMSQISNISMLQSTIANPPSINNIAITGPILLDADEATVLKLLSSQTPLSQDYNTGHAPYSSHYGQILSLVDQGMNTKIEEHYSIIAQAKNKIGQIGDEITTTATGVSATISDKAGQAWERGKQNKNTIGAVALGGVAVYGLYKFVNWMSSDDTPTTIAEDSENNTDSQKYNQHMKDGHALYKKGKYAQAKEKFEAASLLLVSDNQAGKRIEKCESKTGTTGLWKSKLGTFLKWAGIGIGTLIGGTLLYQLYQKWVGETSDNPGTGAGINNESSVGDSYDEYKKKPENKEKSAKYTNIGTQINNFYDDLYQFPGQTNQAYTEYNLGTSKDLDPGALLRSIDNSFETIESFKSGGGVLLLLLESDLSKLAKTMANMLGTSAGWIVKTLLSYVNTDVGATAGERTEQKIISALSGKNAISDIHKVVRKYLKIMSSYNYAENVYIKEKITQGLSSGDLRQKNEQGTYETITIPDQPEARQKLIESIVSNPENYELGTINVSTYKTEFVNQKLVDVDISLFDSQKIYAHNPQLKNIKDTYDTQRQESHTQIDQNKDQALDTLKTDCEKQLKGGRIQWIKNNVPPVYLIELCGGSTDDDHILSLIQDKGGFGSQIQQFQQAFEDIKKESDITKIKAKVDQYYVTLKEMHTISDGINESVDENGNLILTASTVIHGFGGAMMMCFQATKDAFTGKGSVVKGVAGVYGLAAGLSVLPVPIVKSLSKKLLVKSYKAVSLVGSTLYTHIIKPGGIAGWNKMSGLLKKGLDQALVKASFLPSWMRSGAITRLQQAQQGIPALQQAGAQIVSNGSVSARTAQGLQGFFNNPAIKGILKYSPAIAELGYGLYEARGQNKEAQELKKINQMQADNKKDEMYFDLSVSAVTVTLMTIGIANGRNPVGWGMIALGVGAQGIKAIGDLYYNTKDEFYVNKQQYQQMNIGKLKQSIVEHLYDQDGSKHIARETKFVQMFNYLGTNFDKNGLIDMGIDQAIPILVQADEYGLTGVSAEKLGNSNNLITQKIQHRINYINETLGHSQGKDIKTTLKAYLDQGHGLTGLEKLLSDSRIFAQMKMDEEYQNNATKTKSHNTIAGYGAYLESSLHESCEKRDHMEYLWNTQRDTLSKLIVHSPSYMQELLQIKPEGYAKKYQHIQYIQKYRSYKTLGRAPEQYPDPAIAVQQDDTHLPTQLDLLVDVIDQAPQDLAPVTIDHDQLVSDSSLASVLSVEDIEKKLGLSDKPGQNILYQIARRYLGYTGGNTLHELQNFYPESKKEEQGFYYTEGKRYLNQKGSIIGFLPILNTAGFILQGRSIWGVDTPLGDNSGLNQGFIDALNQGLSNLNDVIKSRNNNINTERLEQFHKIVSQEAQYADEKIKTQIKIKIVDYIKKHSNDACTYVQLPIELVIQGVKAGYGNVGGFVYAWDGSKIIAQGNTGTQNKISDHIVSASDITYLS